MKTFPVAVWIALLALGLGTLPCPAADDTSAKDDLKSAGSNIADAAKKIGTDIKDGTVNAAMQVKTGAVWVASQVKTGAVKVVTSVKEKTADLTDRPGRSAQELIDQARGQVADNRYRDALTTLDKLSHFKLTPDEEKSASELRAKINQAFADGSAGTTNYPSSSK